MNNKNDTRETLCDYDLTRLDGARPPFDHLIDANLEQLVVHERPVTHDNGIVELTTSAWTGCGLTISRDDGVLPVTRMKPKFIRSEVNVVQPQITKVFTNKYINNY